MAYQTGTFSGYNDALDIVRAFVAGLTAWTVDSFVDDSSKYSGDTFTGKRLHVHRGSEYFNFRSATNQVVFEGTAVPTSGIAMYGSRGYSGALSWDYQANGILNGSVESMGGHCNTMVDSGTYYLFSDANEYAVTALFESAYPDVFTKMTFGLTSYGQQMFACNDLNLDVDYLFTHITASEQTNGEYSSGLFNSVISQWTTGLDDETPANNTLIHPLSTVATDASPLRYATNTVTYSPNEVTGNPVFCPSHFWWYNTTGNYQYVGAVPDMYLTSMRYYTNGQEVTLPDSSVYVVFTNNYSDEALGGKGAGIAIKKVT